MSIHDVAQAVRDLAQFGRLSEQSEENLSAILDDDSDDDNDNNDSDDNGNEPEVSEPPADKPESVTKARTSTDTSKETK